MKANEFIADWDRRHTSSPSFQDALDWAEQKINHDAIEKACNIFCHTGCPHKTDSYNCFNNKCDTWKILRRMMEEE